MKKDGGSAFPANRFTKKGGDWGGMTLRQYYAIHAPQPKQESIEDELSIDRNKDPHNEKGIRSSLLEIECYLRCKYADALIAEGEKP